MANRAELVTADHEAVYRLLDTSHAGLTSAEAARRLREYGPNVVVSAPPYPAWRIILDQIASPLIYVLLAAAVVTTVLGHYTDTAVILAVVVLNGVIGFVQEYRATRAIEALQKLAPSLAAVRRDGAVIRVSSAELVPGDLIIVESGMRLAADARLVIAYELLTDESLLTGESFPVSKSREPLPDPQTPMADCANLLFAGSLVSEGRGEAVVYATGSRSELGRIAETVIGVEQLHSPLQRRLQSFANTLSIGIVCLALVTTAVGLLRGMEPTEIFLASIALAVAVIPEGLPIVVTVVLSLGAKRMAERNALLRRLSAAETLGSTQVIATDKTGTLTRNHLVARTIVCGPWQLQVEPEAPLSCAQVEEGQGAECPTEQSVVLAHLYDLLRIGAYCNNADYGLDADGQPQYAGNPVDVALLEVIAVLEPSLLHERSAQPPLSEVPFSSTRKFMATVQPGRDDGRCLYAKGAPEALFARCATEWTPDGPRPLDGARWLEVVARLARDGQRVIALALRPWDKDSVVEEELADLMLVGCVGMIDPPRPEAPGAVRGCQAAGIRVVMVTGDHPETAWAIARQVGIAEKADRDDPLAEGRLIPGPAIASMSDEQLRASLDTACVFARVTPHDKLRIVEQYQALDMVVAVTGDGVNDAPALRRADLGVAMGKGGTEAAREASDIVLLDDSFASIYEAVKQGRYIFENIRKVMLFLLSSGAGTTVALLVALTLGWPLPFVAAQILWINLVTNGLQDVALAFEPGEEHLIRRRPRGARAALYFEPLLIQHTIVIGIVFGAGVLGAFHHVWNVSTDLDPTQRLWTAQTGAATAMVFLQMFHALSCRSLTRSIIHIPLLSNPFLFAATVLAFGAQILFIYSETMHRIFRTAPLPAVDFAIVAAIAVGGVLSMELSKWIARRRGLGGA